MEMRVIVAGSRDFSDYNMMKIQLDAILQNVAPNVIIVSGRARGADTLGEKYADENGLQKALFPADWKNLEAPGAVIKQGPYGPYNAKAGFDRNIKMAEYAAENGNGAIIAFWAGDKGGTYHMVETGEKYKLQVRIIEWRRG
jgi:hypothetical protein